MSRPFSPVFTAVLALGLSAGLVACSDAAEDSVVYVTTTTMETHVKEVSAEETTEAEPTTEVEAAAPTTTQDKGCGTMTGQEALMANVGKVPRVIDGRAWETRFVDTATYDPCADLSWITIQIEGATGSSPRQIMLFHRGEYLGTATYRAYAFHPAVRALDNATIGVTYFWNKPGEPNAARSGESYAEFTWDEAQQKVVMSGEVPDDRFGALPSE